MAWFKKNWLFVLGGALTLLSWSAIGWFMLEIVAWLRRN